MWIIFSGSVGPVELVYSQRNVKGIVGITHESQPRRGCQILTRYFGRSIQYSCPKWRTSQIWLFGIQMLVASHRNSYRYEVSTFSIRFGFVYQWKLLSNISLRVSTQKSTQKNEVHLIVLTRVDNLLWSSNWYIFVFSVAN